MLSSTKVVDQRWHKNRNHTLKSSWVEKSIMMIILFVTGDNRFISVNWVSKIYSHTRLTGWHKVHNAEKPTFTTSTTTAKCLHSLAIHLLNTRPNTRQLFSQLDTRTKIVARFRTSQEWSVKENYFTYYENFITKPWVAVKIHGSVWLYAFLIQNGES